jgi:hypothetical protein
MLLSFKRGIHRFQQNGSWPGFVSGTLLNHSQCHGRVPSLVERSVVPTTNQIKRTGSLPHHHLHILHIGRAWVYSRAMGCFEVRDLVKREGNT